MRTDLREDGHRRKECTRWARITKLLAAMLVKPQHCFRVNVASAVSRAISPRCLVATLTLRYQATLVFALVGQSFLVVFDR